MRRAVMRASSGSSCSPSRSQSSWRPSYQGAPLAEHPAIDATCSMPVRPVRRRLAASSAPGTAGTRARTPGGAGRPGRARPGRRTGRSRCRRRSRRSASAITAASPRATAADWMRTSVARLHHQARLAVHGPAAPRRARSAAARSAASSSAARRSAVRSMSGRCAGILHRDHDGPGDAPGLGPDGDDEPGGAGDLHAAAA